MQGEQPLVGQVVGSYEILRELGRGGMGVVYKAHETSLNRMVALKVLPSYLATDQAFLNRFVREARAAASLIHPNVVTIHAVGEDRGTHFIAMEYVKGQTISQLIRQSGTIHPERALQIVLDAADALAMAHKRGIVHRDIKPQNIMIDEAGRVKVMDFGLARAVTSESNLTADGAMIGTPMYMSPEQCEGKKADQRSDIYALGVVLYEMLTGRTPYDAATPLAIMRQIVDRPFPNVHQISPVVSEEVNRILHRMVAKDVADRYQSIEDVRREVQAALSKSRSVGAIYDEKTVSVDAAETDVQTPRAQNVQSVSELETVLSPLPQTPAPVSAGSGAPSGGHRSSAMVGVVAAVVTAIVMLGGFLFLQSSGSQPSGDSSTPAAVAVVPTEPRGSDESNASVANAGVASISNQQNAEQARLEAEDLARRAEEASRAEAEREAAEREAQKRADEQAALLAAAEEEAARESATERAEETIAELERKKREAEEALAQLQAEREAREALEREAAALRAAEAEARQRAAELEREQQEAEAARMASQPTAEQKAAQEAAARRAAEQEAARKAAAAAAAKKAAEEQAAKKAAEEEAARLAALEAAKPAFPDVSGEWRASGKQPHEENRGRDLDPNVTIFIDGTTARILIDGKELTGQYVNGRLTGTFNTTISATGRSGKGRTQVAQDWAINLQAVSDNRMEGTFSVTHTGFQASESSKNGTRNQACVLTR